ncbi:replication initiation protein [Spirosoma sp. RP8]|uniref:Replication initiation protein n=1 Tax=Spirosoma liriopis TaxID=2937440 RepID=A0ABT0HUP0_9BACT|nr:replication initiation protein [Spirosoma liriopis]MCK8495864.1 replication initiation protein [Spirosoma liriopis]
MDEQSEQLHIAFKICTNNYQPNAITESRQEFTEIEKRIVVMAINQLRHIAEAWRPGRNVTVLIPYNELTNNQHNKISSAAKTLSGKRIIPQNFSKANRREFDYITPFPRIRTKKINGKRYLELVMFADVIPAFIELGKRYTSYSIKLMLSLSSIYAQRMYEIIMMFYGRGQKVFSYEVNKLRAALNYPAEHDYYDFKRKALTVAQSELARKVGLHVAFTPSLKSGKAVIELRFEVVSDNDLINTDVETDLRTAQSMQPHEVMAIARNLIHAYTFTRQQQNLVLEDMNLMNIFIRLHTEFHHGKRVAKNPTAYMAQALGFGKAKANTEPAEKAAPGRKGQPRTVKNLLTDAIDKLK